MGSGQIRTEADYPTRGPATPRRPRSVASGPLHGRRQRRRRSGSGLGFRRHGPGHRWQRVGNRCNHGARRHRRVQGGQRGPAHRLDPRRLDSHRPAPHRPGADPQRPGVQGSGRRACPDLGPFLRHPRNPRPLDRPQTHRRAGGQRCGRHLAQPPPGTANRPGWAADQDRQHEPVAVRVRSPDPGRGAARRPGRPRSRSRLRPARDRSETTPNAGTEGQAASAHRGPRPAVPGRGRRRPAPARRRRGPCRCPRRQAAPPARPRPA